MDYRVAGNMKVGPRISDHIASKMKIDPRPQTTFLIPRCMGVFLRVLIKSREETQPQTRGTERKSKTKDTPFLHAESL